MLKLKATKFTLDNIITIKSNHFWKKYHYKVKRNSLLWMKEKTKNMMIHNKKTRPKTLSQK